jgi:hypothetical protein
MTKEFKTWKASRWEDFAEVCEANCETVFDYRGNIYFITNILGDGHDGWFCSRLVPGGKCTYDPVSRDCETLEALSEEPMFDGLSPRECYMEFDIYNS